MIKGKNWKAFWGDSSKVERWQVPDRFVLEYSEKNNLHNKKILDFGSGVGRHSFLFESKGAIVTSIENSIEAVEVQRNLIDKHKSNIDLHLGGFEKLSEFKDQDLTVLWNVIYHYGLQKVKDLLVSISDTLKKNGEAIITFISKNSSHYNHEVANDNGEQLRENKDGSRYITTFFSREDIKNNLPSNLELIHSSEYEEEVGGRKFENRWHYATVVRKTF
jgi:2-polyprenyl-3-methyl-5-hydroxy-6-metoxy-1,4-benzoquinol methylase